jgi:hypothetical protein
LGCPQLAPWSNALPGKAEYFVCFLDERIKKSRGLKNFRHSKTAHVIPFDTVNDAKQECIFRKQRSPVRKRGGVFALHFFEETRWFLHFTSEVQKNPRSLKSTLSQPAHQITYIYMNLRLQLNSWPL